MNSIFINNLATIAKKAPKVATFLKDYSPNEQPEFDLSKSGDFCVKRENKAIHSFYNPQKEAQTIVNNFVGKNKRAKTLIILGTGLFYHVREFLKHYDNIYLLEADLDLLQASLSKIDLSSLLAQVNLLPVDPSFKMPHLTDYDLFPHPILYNLKQQNYENFLNKGLQADDISLKILVVGPLYGGSLPMLEYISDALRNLNHEVVVYDSSSFKAAMDTLETSSKSLAFQKNLRQNLTELIASSVFAKALDQEVDLVLGIAQSPLTIKILRQLRERNIVTAYWFVEDFRTLLYWQFLAPEVDYFFIIQKEDFYRELKQIKCRNFYYLPVCASISKHQKIELSQEEKEKYGSDLSFIGAGYYNRRRAFVSLLNYDFKIWGNDWNLESRLGEIIQDGGRRISPDEAVKIFNASKINLNLHSSTFAEDINPNGDFVNPRTFEIALSGNFQLVDKRILLKELLSADEVASYSSIKELKNKIDYYLKDEKSRNEITQKTRARVLKDHTYEARLKEMLAYIISKEKHLQNKKKSFDYHSFMKELEKSEYPNIYQDLKDLYGENHPKEINLRDVLDYLKNKKQPLEYDEGLIVLMDQLYKFAERKKILDQLES